MGTKKKCVGDQTKSHKTKSNASHRMTNFKQISNLIKVQGVQGELNVCFDGGNIQDPPVALTHFIFSETVTSQFVALECKGNTVRCKFY